MRAEFHPASGLSVCMLCGRWSLIVLRLRIRRGTLLVSARRTLLVSARRTLLILRWRTLLVLLRSLLILRWRPLLILRWRALLVLLRPLLVLLLRIPLLITLLRHPLLILARRALLILTLHLTLPVTVRLGHLAELILLIARQRSHQLTTHLAHRSAIARTSLRMRLRIIVNDGLHTLLLIAGKIQLAHFACPTLLQVTFARHVLAMRTRGRRCALLLSVCADRRRNGGGENACGQEVDLHGLDLIPSAAETSE